MQQYGVQAANATVFSRALKTWSNAKGRPWPDRGGPPYNTFLPPHAVSGGNTTNLFLLGLRPKLKPTAHFQKLLPFQHISCQGVRQVPDWVFRQSQQQRRQQGREGAQGGSDACRGIQRPKAQFHPAWTSLRPPGPWTHCGEGSGSSWRRAGEESGVQGICFLKEYWFRENLLGYRARRGCCQPPSCRRWASDLGR